MRIKIKNDTIFSQNATIVDVWEMEERLEEGFGFREGTFVDLYIKNSDLLEGLRKLCKDGFVTKFEAHEGFYKLGYLTYGQHGLVSKEIEIDLSEASQEFCEEFSKCFSWYDAHHKKFNKRCLEKLFKEGDPHDTLVRCYYYLIAYLKNSKEQMKNSLLSVEEIYHLKDYMTLFRPLFEHEFVEKVRLFRSPLYGIFLICGVMLFWAMKEVYGYQLLSALLCGYGVIGAVLEGIGFFDSSDETIDRAIELCLYKLELEYADEIDFSKKITSSKDKGLVDFVEDDLSKCAYIDEDALRSLTRSYSKNRDAEFFDGGTVVNKYDYLLRLIEAEIAMCSKNSKRGYMDRDSFINDNVVLERWRFVGFDIEKVQGNEFAREILDGVRSIQAARYEGCEVDILNLLKLSIQYIRGEQDVEYLKNSLEFILANASLKREMSRFEVQKEAILSLTAEGLDEPTISRGKKHVLTEVDKH